MAYGHQLLPSLLLAVEQFNRGEYFASHETLEALWKAERGRPRQLYQGMIQVAAGLHHLQRGNYPGAISLLEKGLGKLRHFPGTYLGLDVPALAREAGRTYQHLVEVGPPGVGTVARETAPEIRMVQGC